MRILFVCTGNICRSPMAEIIFANLCKKRGRGDIIIKGAGTHAHEGEYMTAEAVQALKTCGEKVGRKPHLSTQFRPEMVNSYDYIITMTRDHANRIGSFPNVYNLSDFAPCGDIVDPYAYSQGVYLSVCRQLQQSLEILYNKIVKEQK